MFEPLSDERLAEIRAREMAATEKPWVAWDSGVGYHIGVGELPEGGQPVRLLPARLLPEGMRTDIGRRGDAEFIAAARVDVPDLLAEVERLRKAVAVLKPALVHDPDTSACRLREERQAALSPCQQTRPEGDWACRGCAAIDEAGVLAE